MNVHSSADLHQLDLPPTELQDQNDLIEEEDILPPSIHQQFKVLTELARPYSRILILTAALTLFNSAATLTIPWLAGNLTGNLLAVENSDTPKLITLLTLALVGTAILTTIVQIVTSDTALRILADLRAKLYDHVQSLPTAWHTHHRQGDILALMTNEVGHLGNFLTGTLISIPPLIATAAGAAILMLRIDVTLALLVPLLIPFYFVIMKLTGRRLRTLSQKEQRSHAHVFALAENNMGALAAIKSFSREGIESARYRKLVEYSRTLGVSLARIEAIIEPLSGLIASLGALTLLLLIGSHLEQGKLDSAELFSFLFYAALLTKPVSALADTWAQIQVSRGTLARMTLVLSTPPEPGYTAPARLISSRGQVTFENVHFAYPGRSPVLENFILTIQAGEKVAILGENGAGKSTLISLLLRLYDCDSGRILLDGQDITNFQVQDLRKQISLVPQRPQLISGTIRDNIAFGRSDATEQDIKEASRKADAWQFIKELPQGLDTQVGDRGIRLSGGQGQRIALARAILKDAPIVVLDEATSMYDTSGEIRFVENCTRQLHDRTVIIITHRPASVALADRVITLPSL